MRSAFIEPEKAIVEQINAALSKLDTFKNIFTKNPKAKEDFQKILIDARNNIETIKETYKNLQSPEYTTELTNLWNSITTNTSAFSQDVNEMRTTIDAFARQITPMETREDTIGEFIANISANRDGGAAQRAVLINISANVALSAFGSIMGLVPETAIENRHTITNWLHEHRVQTRPHVEFALRQEIAHLTEAGDEDIRRMWQNQEAAVNDFIAQLITLDQKALVAQSLQDTIAMHWEEYERLHKALPKRKQTDRQTEFVTIISEAVEALYQLQKKLKFPPNDFGLRALLHEIQFGQKETFERYRKTQKDFRKVMEDSNALANASPPASPVSSRSTRSSSFFSNSSSRSSSSRSSMTSSRSTSSCSESDEDAPPRRVARMF